MFGTRSTILDKKKNNEETHESELQTLLIQHNQWVKKISIEKASWRKQGHPYRLLYFMILENAFHKTTENCTCKPFLRIVDRKGFKVTNYEIGQEVIAEGIWSFKKTSQSNDKRRPVLQFNRQRTGPCYMGAFENADPRRIKKEIFEIRKVKRFEENFYSKFFVR